MSLRTEQSEFTKDVAKLIDYAFSIDIELTFGEAYRTAEQQKIYVNSGKSKTMASKHLDRLAVDFNFFINGKLIYNKEKIAPLGKFWEDLNEKNRWGGNFSSFTDSPHFERNIK